MLRKFILHAKASLVQHLLPGRLAKRVSLKATLPGDPSLLATSFYKTAFGRLAGAEGLANRIRQLQSGMSFEALGEELVASADFRARHGLTQKVDPAFLKALYRDGLGRKPDPRELAHWLAAGERGATRANVLAAFAASEEAMSMVATMCVNSLYMTAFG